MVVFHVHCCSVSLCCDGVTLLGLQGTLLKKERGPRLGVSQTECSVCGTAMACILLRLVQLLMQCLG